MPTRRGCLVTGATVLIAGCGPVEGKTLPQVELPALPGLVGPNGWPVPGFAADEFSRGVALLNVWASWCPYCQAEHAHLLALARDGRFRMLGLVFRDTDAKAVAYLKRAGNPYAAAALDDGRLSGALGQRGVPHSYVVGRAGEVLLKIAGGIDPGVIESQIMPAVERALAGARA